MGKLDDLMEKMAAEMTGKLGMKSVDKKLLSPSDGDDDILIGQSGFNALLGGSIFRGKGTSINRISYFLTATSFNDNQAVIRFILPGKGVYRQPAASRSLGQSVRCVKD